MSDDYPATVPAELVSEPAPAQPKPPPAFIPMPMPMPEHSNRKLRIAFTGSGSEYFRIWSVNLLLTLVTLGLYFPWAKVRRMRYFYGNTVVGGEPLSFHGNAFTMFKGFVIVVAFVALYSVAVQASPTAGFVAFLMFAALWPALFKSSMQFRMTNTRWHGLRFGFSGSARDAYAACLPLFMPGALLLGVLLMTPELQGAAMDQAPSAIWLSLFAVVMVVTVVVSPWLIWNLRRYQHSHYHLGPEQTQFGAHPRSYYGLCLQLIAVAFLICLMLIALVLTALMLDGILGAGALHLVVEMANGPMALVVIATAAGFFLLLAFAAIKPYAIARSQNLRWTSTRSGRMQFVSSLRARTAIALHLKNWFLILLTLGLYWPFASIAMARLRLQSAHIVTNLLPTALVAAAAIADGQTAVNAAGDLFGFDIAF